MRPPRHLVVRSFEYLSASAHVPIPKKSLHDLILIYNIQSRCCSYTRSTLHCLHECIWGGVFSLLVFTLSRPIGFVIQKRIVQREEDVVSHSCLYLRTGGWKLRRILESRIPCCFALCDLPHKQREYLSSGTCAMLCGLHAYHVMVMVTFFQSRTVAGRYDHPS